MHLFCFGLGYVTQILIKQLSSQWKISGSHTGKRALKKNEYLFNSEAKFQIDVLDDVTHILISIPPTNEGDTVFLEFEEYIKKLPKLKWVGYFSSTSVYGDHQGEWVNELSETRANDGLGKNRLIAEKQWLESGLPINIFRLASIYGEGRSALEAIKSGRATRIFKENHCFSRIHVKDLAKIVAKVIDNPIDREIFNLSDDTPSPQHEVIEFASKLLNITPPPLIDFTKATLSPGMRDYYLSNKRVENNKIKNIYNYKFIFPSYKEGLTALYRDMHG